MCTILFLLNYSKEKFLKYREIQEIIACLICKYSDAAMHAHFVIFLLYNSTFWSIKLLLSNKGIIQ